MAAVAAVAAVMAAVVVAGAIKPLTRSKEAYKGCLADSQTALYFCAEHVRQLGGENPLHNLMEVHRTT